MLKNTIPKNSGTLCRTCLAYQVNLRSIESNYADCEITMRDILIAMGFIKPSISNVVTEYICNNCINQLRSAYKFKLLCEKSSATLEEYNKEKCIFLEKHEFSSHDLQTVENVAKTSHFKGLCKIEHSDDVKKLSDKGIETELSVEDKNDNTTFTCDYCSWSTSKLSILKCHIEKIHETVTKKYICNVCGKALMSRNGYYIHMKIHRRERNHICPKCGAKFVTSNSLTVHQRVHDEIKPFWCTYLNCVRTFQTKAAMETHMRCVHTYERPFQCKTCLKTFSTQSNFTIHCRSHLSIKLVNCTICSKPLANAQSLKKHLRIHTGERPYKCQECGEKLISSSSLSAHMQVKHSTVQYECHTCHKQFHLLTVLRKHLKIHFR